MHDHPHADPTPPGDEIAPHGDDHADCPDCQGTVPYVRAQPKVGRNDPCPCHSGRKFKKCCGS